MGLILSNTIRNHHLTIYKEGTPACPAGRPLLPKFRDWRVAGGEVKITKFNNDLILSCLCQHGVYFLAQVLHLLEEIGVCFEFGKVGAVDNFGVLSSSLGHPFAGQIRPGRDGMFVEIELNMRTVPVGTQCFNLK